MLQQHFFSHGIFAVLFGGLLSVFIPSDAIAAPSVSSASGIWNHKATITVNGSGFGTKATAAPVVWDDASGTNVTDKWSGYWPSNSGATYNTMYRSSQRGVAMPHGNVSKYIAGAHAGPGGADGGAAVAIWKTWSITFPTNLFVSYYVRSDPAFTTTRADINYKINAYSQGDGPYSGEYWYLEYYGWKPGDSSATYHFNGVQRPDANGHDIWWDAGNDPQQWRKVQYQLSFLGAVNGVIKVWEDGVNKADYLGRTEPVNGTNTPGTRSFTIGGYTDEEDTNNWRYYADVYFDFSWARVVLANSTNINNATIIEPQIPSAWNANSITLSSNLGKFTSGQTAYLFVYDSTGTSNTTGYPVTIGSGGGGDTQAPTWPTGTTFSTNATSSSSITVTWSAATDNIGVTNYIVERCQGTGCSNFTQVGTPTASPFVDSGLTANTLYNYHVRAVDGAGNLSGWSNVVGATTQVQSATPTMGETNILGTGDSGNGNLLLAQQATLSQVGTLQSLSFYVTTAAGNLRLGVYDATGPSGGPGALKAQTASFVPTTGWNTQNVTTPISLTAGTYWLAYLPSSSSLAFVRDGTGSFKYYSYAFGVLPTTFSTTPSSGTDHWSFYATLTSGGGTFTPCNTITTTNFSQSTYNSYGAPFDAFQTNTNLISATCNSADPHTIQATLGQTGDMTRIVYTKGYYYAGSAWTQYSGTCTGALNGEWCQGSVSATITNPNFSTASAASPAYFVGMTCSVQGGGWKCGCRDTTCSNFYWMIQGAGM